MQLAPVSPTYTEQRDALLAAALASDQGDFLALAEAFARRGAGHVRRRPRAPTRTISRASWRASASSLEISLVRAELRRQRRPCVTAMACSTAEESGTIAIEIVNAARALDRGGMSIEVPSAGVIGASDGARVVRRRSRRSRTGTATVAW